VPVNSKYYLNVFRKRYRASVYRVCICFETCFVFK